MADQQTFDVIFSGDIIEGFILAAVKEKAAQIFNMSGQKVDALFQGKSLALKKNIDATAANKYQKVLSAIGMVVCIAAHEAVSPPIVKAVSPSVDEPVIKRVPLSPEKDKSASFTSTSLAPDWTLDHVGALLTDSSLAEVVNAEVRDSPDYTLRPQPCNILTSEEIPDSTSPPPLPDLDNMTMGDVGENLLKDSEKRVIAVASVDVSDVSMSEVGSELLSSSERRTFIAVQVDTSDIHLLD